MNITEFKKIFNKCMKQNKNSITPHMCIRNFDIEMPNLRDSNFNEEFDLNKCDVNFINFEDAWDYFKDLFIYRIMDATGQIWADNYCLNKNKEV